MCGDTDTAPTAAHEWTVNDMAKCKDCLHYEACSAFSKVINAAMDVEKGCEHFKDRTKYAEVVRCKDCKYRSGLNGRPPFMFYICACAEGLSGAVRENNFRSCGERKDGDTNG